MSQQLLTVMHMKNKPNPLHGKGGNPSKIENHRMVDKFRSDKMLSFLNLKL